MNLVGVSSKAELESNFFQRHLIPDKSKFVRASMQKAAEWSTSPHLLYQRIGSVALATCAVVMSVFNTFSYFLRIPFKMVINIIQFDLIHIIPDLMRDLTYALRSFIFVSLGVTFLVIGMIVPSLIFPYFAPELFSPIEEKMRLHNFQLEQQILQLKEDNKKDKERMAHLCNVIQQLDGGKRIVGVENGQIVLSLANN